MEGIPKKEFDDVLNSAKKLRTIFSQEGFVFPSPLSNKRLRVLHRLVDLDKSQKSISSSSFLFKHMRYLDLYYSDLEDVNAAESINQLYNLQTLNLYKSKNIHNILKGISSLINLRHLNISSSDVNLIPNSITMLINLQTFTIRNCRDISVLPLNIGHLKNLLSLDISNTNISELPDSICLLSKLTNFNFYHCHQLKALPRSFGALTQLRLFDLRYTKIRELPDSLTSKICKLEFVNLLGCEFPTDIKNWVELRILRHFGLVCHQLIMPRGIENLTRLEVLVPFIVRKEDDVSIDNCRYNSSSSSIHELADLNSLQELEIQNLENVKGGKIEAKKAKLKYKKNIQNLHLRWTFKEEDEEEVVVNNSVMVLEGLQPHPNLEILHIWDFPGSKTPKWMGSPSCLPNLVDLRFDDSKSCTKLVGLGQLPCLQILRIERMHSVECLGNEFYYQQEEEVEESKGSLIATTATRTLFPSLTTLYIEELEKLEEWSAPPSPPDNSFPRLENVEIYGCHNLTSIPDLRLWTSSLRSITIWYCKNLEKEHMAYYFDKSLPSVQYQLD